eukprot:GHVS01040710.1.p1 GENE.GHVS01040710.1~~GHVS01040710.1.p1  ORF type:complete len:927 (+),score=159.09 GHVS01040710.1:82-2781(+)
MANYYTTNPPPPPSASPAPLTAFPSPATTPCYPAFLPQGTTLAPPTPAYQQQPAQTYQQPVHTQQQQPAQTYQQQQAVHTQQQQPAQTYQQQPAQTYQQQPAQTYQQPVHTQQPPAPTHQQPVQSQQQPVQSYQQPRYQQHDGFVGSPVASTELQAEAALQEALQFNALPHFVRPSFSRLPNSASVKQKLHLPIGVVVQPLCPPPLGCAEVPSVNFGNSMVVRCKRCRSYVNPFVQWEANGRRWLCNMCEYVNDTPQFYYRPLDEHGQREDRFQRAELCLSSVEFIAPPDYMVRPPQPPTFMFVVDVSLAAVTSGLVDIVCQGIKAALASGNLCGGNRCLIGVMTFDTTVHFYNLSPALSQPQMVVVADLEELFIPLPDNILVNATEAMATLNGLLDSLPNMWRQNRINESCLGSAIRAAYLAMKHIGGKMMLFASTLPTVGDFQLKSNRESAKVSSKTATTNGTTDREVQLLKPEIDSYKSFAEALTKSQISSELFVCSPTSTSMDLATLCPMVKLTSGDLHYLPQFNAHTHGDKLHEELVHSLTRATGWEAVMRFRVSRGWRISNWFGHFFFRAADLLVIPCCQADQSYAITLEMEENVVQDALAYLQTALLYTNSDGERRIRVHSYCLPVTQHFTQIANSVDVQVTSVLLAQQAMQMAVKSKLADARNFLQGICSQVLSTTAQPSAQQLESLKLLPLYILGMLKSVAFREAKDVTADQRIYHWMRLDTLSVDMQAVYFYPRLISVHNLQVQHGTPDETEQVVVPTALNLTSEHMTQEGAYMLEDGEVIMLWIGKGVSVEWIEAVFGVQSLEQLHPDYAEAAINTAPGSVGARVLAILQALRDSRQPPFMKLLVIRQGDPSEHKFFSSLIEDRTHSLMLSYQEFLTKLGGSTWRRGY